MENTVLKGKDLFAFSNSSIVIEIKSTCNHTLSSANYENRFAWIYSNIFTITDLTSYSANDLQSTLAIEH